MADESYDRFKWVSHYGDTDYITEIENNMKHFFDWSLLKIGAWNDVNIPTSGAYGGNFHQLRCLLDPAYTDGQIWQAVRKDWCYETGVNYVNGTGIYNPISEPEIYVSGILQTGNYYINYPNGLVVFDSAIPTDATVSAKYSYRAVQVYRADEASWWKELQFRSLRPDDTLWTDNSGEYGPWGIGPQHRVQMPAIVVESVMRSSSSPYELGNSANWKKQDVLFHVFAENKSERNKLVTYIESINDKGMWIYNSDLIVQNNDFPLDYRGMVVSSPKMYPNFVSPTGYRYKKIWVTDVNSFEGQTPFQNLFVASVRATIELVIGNI